MDSSAPDCSSDDFDERSYVMIGVDGLMHVAPGLRLGVGYALVPFSGIDIEYGGEDDTFHLGHEHALGAIIEGLLPFGNNLALALRAQGGARMFIVGGDMGDAGDRFLTQCKANNQTCSVDRGPFFGGHYGAMLGLIGGSKTRWRIDLALDRIQLTLPSSSENFAPVVAELIDTDLYTTRFWALGGVEF